MISAAAEVQSGNATALESGAKGKEGLVNAFLTEFRQKLGGRVAEE